MDGDLHGSVASTANQSCILGECYGTVSKPFAVYFFLVRANVKSHNNLLTQISSLFGIVLIVPLAGMLSDHSGRTIPMIGGAIGVGEMHYKCTLTV